MKHTSTQSGYSLVEALIAISVLMIAIIGPMTIASQGIKSSNFSLEQNAAFFLAQEGIEAIFAIRGDYALKDIDDGLGTGDPDTSWNWLNDELGGGSPCSDFSSDGDSCDIGIDFRSSDVASNIIDCSTPTDCQLYIDTTNTPAVYTHVPSVVDQSPYTRVVTVTRESAESVKVTSTVTWNSRVFGGDPRTIELTTHIFDSNYE